MKNGKCNHIIFYIRKWAQMSILYFPGVELWMVLTSNHEA